MPSEVERLALAGELVLAVLEELAGSDVEGQDDVLAELVARRLDAFSRNASACSASTIGREAALVADRGVVAGILEQLLQRVEDLGPGAQRLAEESRRPPAGS